MKAKSSEVLDLAGVHFCCALPRFPGPLIEQGQLQIDCIMQQQIGNDLQDKLVWEIQKTCHLNNSTKG